VSCSAVPRLLEEWVKQPKAAEFGKRHFLDTWTIRRKRKNSDSKCIGVLVWRSEWTLLVDRWPVCFSMISMAHRRWMLVLASACLSRVQARTSLLDIWVGHIHGLGIDAHVS
jgi:hypothetical protein